MDFGVTNNDMLTLTRSAGLIQRNINSNDKDLLNNFFTSLNSDVANAPSMNFNQMFNSIFHN